MNTSSRFVIAIHILAILGGKKMYFKDFEGMKSEELAQSVNTNPVFIRRLLGNLNRAGLVVSKSGPNGGTSLAQNANEITIDKIYEAVEDGELFHLHYGQPNQMCPVGGHIQGVLSDVFNGIRNSVNNTLAKYTLADIVQETLRCAGILEELKKNPVHLFEESSTSGK
jgi:Rrf2 family protein